MGLSSQEILVLRSLQTAAKQLDAREAGLETREEAAAAAEQRLQEQIGDLKKRRDRRSRRCSPRWTPSATSAWPRW